MQVRQGWIIAVLLGLVMSPPSYVSAQSPPQPAAQPPGGRGGGGRGRVGGFVPGLQRPPGDPALIERGKTLYGINCTGCHGADLRGGDMGGPNLLRSQVALSDKDGELIVPILEGSRQSAGMPKIALSGDDEKAMVQYLHNMLESIGNQGKPPSIGKAAPDVLVGDAKAGQVYFDSKCAGCHSATGDLAGIGSRMPDAKSIQNAFVSGGGGGRGGRGGDGPPSPRTVMVAVTMPSGETVEGRLVRIDDFFVTLRQADETVRTFRRNGDTPKVEVKDPMKAHRDLLGV
jgi:cytochrome c oxidase cbb3-type subunit 3